ncbi:caspase family protein [Roseibium sp.]|uniref:caspase family protein n=1 Tax=Roseibium sp. TaxID=1936156 RepID=UPI003BADB486
MLAASKMKKAMIVIAVSKYRGAYQDLPGVLTSAARLVEWAKVDTPGRGYEVLEITDADGQDVTVDRLRHEIPKFLETRGVDRLFVYFAGHGLARSGSDQFWLLTGASDDLREGINFPRFVEGVSRYGLASTNKEMKRGQLIVVADACRNSSNHTINFVGDPILTRSGPTSKLEVELNLSTTLGEYSFQSNAVDGGEPYCIFSDALCDALEGGVSEVLDEVSGLGTVIHNQLLANYLEEEVKKRAQELNEDMTPDMNPALRIYNHYYDILDDKGKNPEEQSNTDPSVGTKSPSDEGTRPPASSKRPRARARRVTRKARSNLAPDRSLEHAYNLIEQSGAKQKSRGSVVVDGELNVAIPTQAGSGSLTERYGVWRFEPQPQKITPQPIVCQGDAWTLVPMYPNSISLLLSRNSGDILVYSGESDWDTSLTTGMFGGSRRVPRISDALSYADAIRSGKEIQPQRADLAAYVYRMVGDQDNIIRTAHFMVKAGFLSCDLALLAGQQPTWTQGKFGWQLQVDLPAVEEYHDPERPRYATIAMNARDRVVANTLFPVYRQGWLRMQELSGASVPKVINQIAGMALGYAAVVLPKNAINIVSDHFDYAIHN